ncbi:uncharacterized protein TRIADDRAFT_29876, partial [Trichoplax adhaerens]
QWSVELEEQEKVFLKQAAQVNSWDDIIRENQKKIIDLSDYVENLKADQDRLNSELDFIDTQQRELEHLLSPLETTVQQQSSSFGSHLIDKEREQMYSSACELDVRLQQMCHDLTEVIEKLNKCYSGQNNNPMQQVTKILNSHTEALKWIDKNAEFLKRKVDNVVSQSEIKRNEQEHSLRLVSL